MIPIRRALVSGSLPESHSLITTLVEERLRAAGVYGKTPTDLDALLDDASIKLIEDDPSKIESFIRGLGLTGQNLSRAKRNLDRGLNKAKGAFGFRERVAWVKSQKRDIYERFPKAHELTHGVLEWHDTSQFDDHYTLDPSFKDAIEREANFGASEFLFQCSLFQDKVMGKHESIESALALADEHDATKASTLWRYARVHDRAVAILFYQKDGNGYKIRRAVGSPRFVKEHSGLMIPERLQADHEWISRSFLSPDVRTGDNHMDDERGRFKFEWQSWTNQYDYFVLLSKSSKLHLVSNLGWPFGKAHA